METYTFVLSLITLTASVFYVFWKIIPSKPGKNEQVSAYPLPPGSTGWPFIGETLEFARTARNGVPEKFVNDRRNKYASSSLSSSSTTTTNAAGDSCKVFKTSLLGETMAMLCTPAGNKFLFSNENKLVKVWWPSYFDKLIPNFHEKENNFSAETIHSRKDVAPFLKPGALQNYVHIIGEVAKHHFDTHWCSSSPSQEKQVVKVHPLAKKFTFTLACKIFLNLEDPVVIARMEELMRHITVGIASLPIDLPGTNFRRGKNASKQMQKEIESLVVKRKLELMSQKKIDPAQPQPQSVPHDLLSSWLMETVGSDGEERNVSGIAGKLFGPLIGAYETFVSTTCSMIMYLSELPHVYDAVLKEQMEIADSKLPGELLTWEDIQKMKYTWNVACEVLRLRPPSSGTFREATTDFVYEGHLIPKGMKLHWNAFATHKNPEYFPDPEKFDPARFEGQGPPPYSYVPFGGGPRMCPGKGYARLVILVFIHNLVTRFKWEKVFPDEKIVMNPVATPSQGLPIRLYPQ